MINHNCSPPIGVVSDTFHLISKADSCLLVVRPGYTLKDVLERTMNEILRTEPKGHLVVNGMKSDNKQTLTVKNMGILQKKTEKGLARIMKR